MAIFPIQDSVVDTSDYTCDDGDDVDVRHVAAAAAVAVESRREARRAAKVDLIGVNTSILVDYVDRVYIGVGMGDLAG